MTINKPDIVRFISNAVTTVDFNALRLAFSARSPVAVRALKRAVKDLMEDRILCYVTQFGRSAIQLSYNHPVCVSPHVVLKPDQCKYHPAPNQYVISLVRGAAFGGGEHPTTRMCIQLIDDCLSSKDIIPRKETVSCLDIGTGSGVLAIVAAMMGIKSVLAVDNSPCAIHEARKNIFQNGLEKKIRVEDKALDTLFDRYGLVLANLRMPTLIALGAILDVLVEYPGHLIFSGIKTEETGFILDAYSRFGFSPSKTLSEKGWDAVWLSRDRDAPISSN